MVRSVTFGKRLRKERKRLGLTQSKIAEIASITRQTQINYEKGERSPDSDYLSTIAAVGADVLYVLTGQRTPSREEALDPREKAVLDNYRALSEGGQAAVQRLTHALKESPPCVGDGTKNQAG